MKNVQCLGFDSGRHGIVYTIDNYVYWGSDQWHCQGANIATSHRQMPEYVVNLLHFPNRNFVDIQFLFTAHN